MMLVDLQLPETTHKAPSLASCSPGHPPAQGGVSSLASSIEVWQVAHEFALLMEYHWGLTNRSSKAFFWAIAAAFFSSADGS